MALLYIDEHSASLNQAAVKSGETIVEGEFIVDNGDNTVSAFDPANDELPQGIVVHDPRGDATAQHDEDYFTNYDDLWTYDGDDGDDLYWQPLASVDQIRPRSIDEQSNPSSTEPDFTGTPTIGIVTLGSGETRVVPSGYTYDGTTYSESGAGDFAAIGRLDKYPQELRISSSYDQRIPTRLDADIFTTAPS